MAGLIDSTTGLEFGTGLQFQNPIGGAGLDIVTSPIPPGFEGLIWGTPPDNFLLWGTGNYLDWG